MIHISTHVADAILAILNTMVNDETDMWQEPYQNGREHGHSISCRLPDRLERKQVAFSKDRNSNRIVVYYGVNTDFSMQGNTPSDKVYDNRKIFPYNSQFQAAEFIFDYLTK